jgi:hypothetical protein
MELRKEVLAGIAGGLAGGTVLSALFGGGYGFLRWATRVSPIPAGPLYGMGVYAANLAGVGPLTRLTPGPWKEEPVTVGRRLMMHTVFGVVTALVSKKVRQRIA